MDPLRHEDPVLSLALGARRVPEAVMTENNDQLTKDQLIGMLLLGLCLWAFIIGLIYILAAKNSFPGIVIAVTGIIGGYIVHRWLIFINKPPKE